MGELVVKALLPCPFCGREADYFANGSVSHPDIIVHRVACNCEMQPFTGWHATKEEAIAAWNRRSPEALAARPWRTVDDIPRDGTSVDLLLSSGREVSCAYWGETLGGAEEGWFVGDTWARGEDEEVIRWRPWRSPLSVAQPASRAPGEPEPVAWASPDIVAAWERGDVATPGWERTDVFCIPVYVVAPPSPNSGGNDGR